MRAEVTFRQAEQEIVALCHSGLDSVALRRAVMRTLKKAMPFDAWCMGSIDPDTLLITSEVSEGIPNFAFALAAENEYLINDVNKFNVLARSNTRTGVLSQATNNVPQSSHRYGRVMSTIGAVHELRSVFVSDHECWGGVTIFRTADLPDFSTDESKLLSRLSTQLGQAFRLALLVDQRASAIQDKGLGLIVLGDNGQVEGINSSAQAWLADLVEPNFRIPEGWLPAPIHEVAMRARAIAGMLGEGISPNDVQARLRVRTYSGQWVTLHGSHVIGTKPGASQTAVIIERAHSSQIAGLLMLAYDLTMREREVLQGVLKGLVTKEIAHVLHMSTNTVQDHLKSIFDKVGVHSRGELIARVLGEHYFQHFGA